MISATYVWHATCSKPPHGPWTPSGAFLSVTGNRRSTSRERRRRTVMSHKLRVGLFSDVITTTPPVGWGGLEEMMRHLALGLARTGKCEVFLFASSDSAPLEGVTLVPLTTSIAN